VSDELLLGAISDELMLLAAAGDLDSQREIRDTFLVDPQIAPLTLERARQAEWWARLVAVRGFKQDRMKLAAALLMRSATAGNEATCDDFAVEAIVNLNDMAESGSEDAAAMLVTLGPDIAPEVFARAAGEG